jgi:hypothetical protein
MILLSLILLLIPLTNYQITFVTTLETTIIDHQSDKPINKLAQPLDSYPVNVDFNEIFQQATVDSFYQTVFYLSETIGPRPYGSNSNIQARDWIIKKLCQYLDQGFVFPYGEYQNVIGIQYAGQATSYMPSICFSGHFDTVVGSPGADDNGSGTALFLEIARLLGQYSNLAMTTAFLGCNAEELGLYGAFEMAPYIKNLLDPQLVINADQILAGEPILIYTDDDIPYESYQYIIEMIQSFGFNYGNGYLYLYQTSTDQSWWTRSDHYAFHELGIPVIIFNEADITPYYHDGLDKADQPEYVYDYGAEIAGSLASTILFISSRITDPFTNMDFQGTLEQGLNRTYIIQAREGDFFESQLNTNSSSNDLQIKLLGITDWGSGIDFQLLGEGRHELVVRNAGNSPASYEIRNTFSYDENNNGIADPYEQDPDSDGLSTYEELFEHGTDPFLADTDNDSLDDAFEIELRTDPNSNDTDNDSMDDYYEYVNGLDYWSDDSRKDHDNDGLTNLEEYHLGTHPRSADTDMDGFTDDLEVLVGTNPLDSGDHPARISSESTTSENSVPVVSSPAFEWYVLLLLILPFFLLKKSKIKRKR